MVSKRVEVAEYASRFMVAARANRQCESLKAITSTENETLIPQVFDEIMRLHRAYGSIDEATDVIMSYVCLLTNNFNYSARAVAEMLNNMDSADEIFLKLLHATHASEREQFLGSLMTEKLETIIQSLYRTQCLCRIEASIRDLSKDVYTLEKDQVISIVSIFNECKNGLSTYIGNELMLADMFVQYLRLEIVYPELAFKQFFWDNHAQAGASNTACILEHVRTHILVDSIEKIENPQTQGLWLSYCSRTVWEQYIEWLVDNNTARCYEIAEQVLLGVHNDNLKRMLELKFNDH